MKRKSSIISGSILILVGGVFLVLQSFPGLAQDLDVALYWPLIIVAVGTLFLLSALFGESALAVPGSIVTGIGGLLFYQNATGDWDSWAYAWSLIPGFVGIGLILMGLLDAENRHVIRAGVFLVLISLALFSVFSGLLGEFNGTGRFWPLLLIAFGIWMLFRGRNGRGGPAGKSKL